MLDVTSTGYPVGLSKIAFEYHDTAPVIETFGSNLDAPDAIISGGMFWAPLCNEALPAIGYFRDWIQADTQL